MIFTVVYLHNIEKYGIIEVVGKPTIMKNGGKNLWQQGQDDGYVIPGGGDC